MDNVLKVLQTKHKGGTDIKGIVQHNLLHSVKYLKDLDSNATYHIIVTILRIL